MSHPSRRTDKPHGQILKDAREAKGVSLERVHEITKIPLDVLRAIEEGYTVRTLSNFYFRAFMKKYAQFLGVEVAEVVDDYQPEKLPEPVFRRAEPVLPQKEFDRVVSKEQQQVIVKALGLLLVLFIAWKIGGCAKEKFSRREAVKKTVEVEKMVDVKKPQEKPEPKKEETQAEKVARLKNSKPASASSEPARQGASNKPAASAPATATPAITKPVSMTVKAKSKVWLQVKVDDTVVFQSTMNQGITETWQADREIELSGRNIYNLEFEVNGKTLGQLGRADREARRLIVTKDGMTVKK